VKKVPPRTDPGEIASDVYEAFRESDHSPAEARDRAADAARNARGSAEEGGPARLDRAGAGAEETEPDESRSHDPGEE
jgi:hypothetical protein